MKRNICLLSTLVFSIALAAEGGTISGKVSGAPWPSFVYVNAPAGKTYPEPTQRQTLDHKGLVFRPHIIIVQQGAIVEFLNSANVAHSIFWPSISGDKKLKHNLGTLTKGERKSFKFDNPGIVSLLCIVHSEVSGFIVVSPTPYYAETDANGEYKIENVPEDDYSVTSWHEGMKPQSKPLTVSANTRADFTLAK